MSARLEPAHRSHTVEESTEDGRPVWYCGECGEVLELRECTP